MRHQSLKNGPHFVIVTEAISDTLLGKEPHGQRLFLLHGLGGLDCRGRGFRGCGGKADRLLSQ
jgi:hypothetical protein